MKNYTIGLDLGENNVGWSVYDSDNDKIVDFGVRRFSVASGAADRRSARNVRRRLKRKENRVRETLSLLNEIGFPDNNTIDSNLLEKRVRGLNEKLEKQDITNILCYMMNYRGYIPYGDEEVNFVNLNGKYPCEFYYDLYLKDGYYRNRNLVVKNTENLDELKTILINQSNFYKEITSDFISRIEELFKRKRKFWEGPGNTNSLTPFGRFKTKEDVNNYNENKLVNPNYEVYLYESLIRNCDIVIGEKCAPKLNFYSEYFNFLNDFINISFKNTEDIINTKYITISKDKIKLNKDGLIALKDYCLNNYNVTYISLFKNVLGTKIDNVRGYRIDKSGKPEFSTFNSYRSVLKTISDNNLNTDWVKNIEYYNRVMYIFNVCPGKVELFNMLNNDLEFEFDFSDDELDIIFQLYNKLKKNFGYHNLSEKALVRAINDMERTCLNYMQVNKKFDYQKEAREYFVKNYSDNLEGLPKINKKFVDDIVASPQVKKTLRQAIKVLNAIINKYKCYPSIISIESTHEMNGKEKRNAIIKEQKKNESLRKKAIETIKSSRGESMVNETNILKVMLYEEVNGHCMYCSSPVGLAEVLSAGYEVEHILPYSQSFNDSFDNKTIACTNCNHNKTNKTPYVYLNQIGLYDEFKERVNNLSLSDEKKKNLLFEDDLNKYKTRFFNRNLRDTAYATSELINQVKIFNYFLESKFNDTKILLFSTPGQLTHNLREKYNLPKDRDAGVFHHAVDAAIIASIPNTKVGKYLLESQNNDKFYLTEKDNLDKKAYFIKSIHLDEVINDISKINNDNIKTSMQVIKTPQSKLSDANILKLIDTKSGLKKIKQINNIYELGKDEPEKLKKLFDDNDENSVLLCRDNNIEQYNMLKEIFNKYSYNKNDNPFVNYCLEVNGIENKKDFNYRIHGIKMSKKSNAPVVIKLRYYETITEPYLLEKTSINKKNNTLIALDSLSQYCTKVYVDLDKNKFVFLPIYTISVNQKTGQLKENDKFYQKFYNKYIGNKRVEFICDLFNGDYIEVKKKKSEVVCGNYQYFHKTNNKIILKNELSFTTGDIELKVFNVDVLGNKYIRLTKTLN